MIERRNERSQQDTYTTFLSHSCSIFQIKVNICNRKDADKSTLSANTEIFERNYRN